MPDDGHTAKTYSMIIWRDKFLQ